MSKDDFDDGLFHGHDWAKEPPRPGILPPPPPAEVHDPLLAAAMSRKQDAA
jgi:hypothetical protein